MVTVLVRMLHANGAAGKRMTPPLFWRHHGDTGKSLTVADSRRAEVRYRHVINELKIRWKYFAYVRVEGQVCMLYAKTAALVN